MLGSFVHRNEFISAGKCIENTERWMKNDKLIDIQLPLIHDK